MTITQSNELFEIDLKQPISAAAKDIRCILLALSKDNQCVKEISGELLSLLSDLSVHSVSLEMSNINRSLTNDQGFLHMMKAGSKFLALTGDDSVVVRGHKLSSKDSRLLNECSNYILVRIAKALRFSDEVIGGLDVYSYQYFWDELARLVSSIYRDNLSDEEAIKLIEFLDSFASVGVELKNIFDEFNSLKISNSLHLGFSFCCSVDSFCKSYKTIVSYETPNISLLFKNTLKDLVSAWEKPLAVEIKDSDAEVVAKECFDNAQPLLETLDEIINSIELDAAVGAVEVANVLSFAGKVMDAMMDIILLVDLDDFEGAEDFKHRIQEINRSLYSFKDIGRVYCGINKLSYQEFSSMEIEEAWEDVDEFLSDDLSEIVEILECRTAILDGFARAHSALVKLEVCRELKAPNSDLFYCIECFQKVGEE